MAKSEKEIKFNERDRLPDGSHIMERDGMYALVMKRRNFITGRLHDEELTDRKAFKDLEAAVADLHQRASVCKMIGCSTH